MSEADRLWREAMERAAHHAGTTWLTCPYGEIADTDAMCALSEWTAEVIRNLPRPAGWAEGGKGDE